MGLQGLMLFSMYVLGIVVAAAVALVLKRTLLRGAAPPFLMELPVYKWPSPAGSLAPDVRPRLGLPAQCRHDHLRRLDRDVGRRFTIPRISPSEIAPLIAERDRLEQELRRARTLRAIRRRPWTPAPRLRPRLPTASREHRSGRACWAAWGD